MWLIGMMGSGKTTVGRVVSMAVGADFYDTDEMVEESMGMTVAEVFATSGETAFRTLESAQLRRVPLGDVVAAAGGGAVLDPANRGLMRASGKVVWLKCGVDTLAHRVDDRVARPLLAGERPIHEVIAALLAEREALYSQTASVEVETEGRSLEDVAAEVVGIWSS